MRNLALLLFLTFSGYCTAQQSYKYEKEERIEKKVFPQKGLDLLDKTLPEKVKNVKYYKERDSVKISYESKLKFKRKYYSIEFTEKGLLEDVEVTIKKKQIPEETREKIENYMRNAYDSYRIKKIQRQYNNTNTIDAKQVIQNAFSNDLNSEHFYEIIAEVKTKKERYFIEITFTKDGDFTLVRTIIQSSYDHILY
ncbi:hypothetical protein C8N46_110134 [Kordia periserrulae]|uniref:PepSY domain-containing protein n=1 Tax=Kordia periserrulae TaxID=701523 RepID=A0A2T6BTK4_9FLAO|nr:hypothetical protein [Kordia periserrulae]PTX59297.1 hypothetical protein C8N46_110134 [Kordia periserrulae]